MYGGVKVGTDGSLTQDLALHILTRSYNNNEWTAWAEFFNAADLAKAQTDIATLQTRATTAEANIKTAQTDITTLKSRTSAVETKASTNTANISIAQSDITTLKNRLTTDETAITANKAAADKAIQANSAAIEALRVSFDEAQLYYGIEFDEAVSSPTCTRVGNLALHRSLPVQSRMRGCLLDDDGHVVEYLPADDWTTATRDGSRGQVMVEIPEHWRKCETDGTKHRVLLSTVSLPGYERVPLMYVSAYEATVQRSTSKLASVVNTSTDYRGGNNQSSWDDTYKTLLGRPASVISRTNFRKYARNRKQGSTEWNCMTYDAQKALYWLFVVEYATLNSQASYNAQPTTEGYHQGGLGAGVTTFGSWSAFNGTYPFVPCGATDALGNSTGTVDYVATNGSDITATVSVPRYRGVENPFGHLWQWTDGVNVRISANEANGGDGLSKVFICSDPAHFSDTSYDGYQYVGDEARQNGYAKAAIFGAGGEIIPRAVGGGSTTYFCDSHYTNIPSSGESLRGLLFGGHACGGAYAGFAYACSFDAPSYTYTTIGSRLCFIPE